MWKRTLRLEFALLTPVLIVALCPGCGRAPAPWSAVEVADDFVADLSDRQGEALEPWFRADRPVTLNRRCPDCPASRRVSTAKLFFIPDGRRLGAAIGGGDVAEMRADVSALSVGDRHCEARCCTWDVGLLDHGAVHLERACFDRDSDGPFVVSLSLVDA